MTRSSPDSAHLGTPVARSSPTSPLDSSPLQSFFSNKLVDSVKRGGARRVPSTPCTEYTDESPLRTPASWSEEEEEEEEDEKIVPFGGLVDSIGKNRRQSRYSDASSNMESIASSGMGEYRGSDENVFDDDGGFEVKRVGLGEGSGDVEEEWGSLGGSSHVSRIPTPKRLGTPCRVGTPKRLGAPSRVSTPMKIGTPSRGGIDESVIDLISNMSISKEFVEPTKRGRRHTLGPSNMGKGSAIREADGGASVFVLTPIRANNKIRREFGSQIKSVITPVRYGIII
jgi:hypothetical protein